MPKPQQTRVSEALKSAKTQETLGADSVSDSDRRMWASLRDTQRARILELPLADRGPAIRRAYQKTVSAYQMAPGLEAGVKSWEGPGRAEWVGVGAPDSVSGWKFASDPAGEQAREHLMRTMPAPTYVRPAELGGDPERQSYLESEGLRVEPKGLIPLSERETVESQLFLGEDPRPGGATKKDYGAD